MENGAYYYFLNGEPTGVSETFESKSLPDGSQQTTSTRDAKPFKTMITVETSEKDNRFQNCKIAYQKDEHKIEADYEFDETSFHILRKFNGETIQNETFQLPDKAVFFPLMRCFQGQTVLQVAASHGFTTVIVPDIELTTDYQSLLKPTFDERTAKQLKQEDNRFIYNYLSKHYDDNSEFHLDENGLLIYYEFVQDEQQIWAVRLESTL